MATSDEHPRDYEQAHVHGVYDQIASHFSSTRYKPWPLVSSFLLSLTPGSVGLDVGCGNGKYLSVNPAIYIVASDRSPALADIASSLHCTAKSPSGSPASKDVVVADTLSLPHPNRRFDFAICVAVVHHLSTRERRVGAIRAILDTLRPGPLHAGNSSRSTDGDIGKALIYVWALEQSGSRRGWDEGGEQDVMVPWVIKGRKAEAEPGAQDNSSPQGERTFHRYYHLYRRGELQEDIESAGGVVLEAGYEKDNWWAVASPASSLSGF